MSPRRELTPKQEAFAQYIADGLTQTEAYRRAYSSKAKKTVMPVKGHQVAKHQAVAARIKQLREEAAEMPGLTRATKRRLLAQLAQDRDADSRVRLEAVKIDNMMTGENAAVKVEGEITLGSILREIIPSTGLPARDAKP
jgi:phage terminase small subunit